MLKESDRKFSTGKPAPEQCFHVSKPRDVWREIMLDVRTENDSAFALPYSHLNFIKLETKAITLAFSSHLVTIEGEHLRPLYEALSEHSVRHIAVIQSDQDRTAQNELSITSIDVVAVGQGEDAMI